MSLNLVSVQSCPKLAYPDLPFVVIGRQSVAGIFFGGYSSHWALLLELYSEGFVRGHIGTDFFVYGAGRFSIYAMEGEVARWGAKTLRVVTPHDLQMEIIATLKRHEGERIIGRAYEAALRLWRENGAVDHPTEY